MEVKLLSPSEKVKWDEYIYNHPDSVAWQSYDWNTLIQNHYKVDFFPMAAFNKNNICGVLPLYKVKKGSLLSVPYAVAGGMLTDNTKVQKLLLDKAVELSKQCYSSSITFKQYKIKIEQDLKLDDGFYNRELDLTQPLDLIWNNLADLNKQEIHKNKSLDIQLDYPSKEIDNFFDILLQHQHSNGIPCVSKNWIQDLIDFDMYSIAFLKLDSQIIAATLVKKFKKTVSFPFSCNPDKKESSNMFALYWELIKRFSIEGIEIFHSGRIPKTDKTNIYRLGWGGKKFPYYYQYYPQDTPNSEFSSKRGWKRELIVFIWKKLPKNMVRILGPVIMKKFP